ncbi:MAG: hypothetical protein KA536_15050 [Saprospiraceae bacterium]|jgi:hypothetical protein|nr:hypothetical protein [Saprospiraceae bacterium]
MAKFLIAGYQRFTNVGPTKRAEIVLHLQNRQKVPIPFVNGPDLNFLAVCQILDSSHEKYYNTVDGGRIEGAGGGILNYVEFT